LPAKLDEFRSLASRNLELEKQQYGDEPLEVRETDHYQAEYVQSLVEKWDDLIDWEARAKSEGKFFVELLRKLGKHEILDVAAGTGFHSVRLMKAGFDVTSVDGSATMLSKAFENGKKQGLILRTVHADWRWLNRDLHGKYDAIICLGNSFTHLFSESDRRRALAEFYAALRWDGVLILDQRNYDSILDHEFRSKHTYYYCGHNVSAEPEHVDEGLARFKYVFPDGSKFHLNMFPLRQKYVRRLMKEIGFQEVKTYGDFQETYHEEDPDFLIHVAYKTPIREGRAVAELVSQDVSSVAEQYYDSSDADEFYYNIWGGEDIHVGLYDERNEPIVDASRKTVEKMASMAEGLGEDTLVLDIGAGYGGAARYLAKTYGCRVSCLNISETQNRRNRQLSEEQGLDHLIEVKHGNFEELPYKDDSIDLIWCQDAILHSGRKAQVIAECKRVLKPGGQLLFTDPMQHEEVPEGVLQPVYDRIHLQSLGSFEFYRRTCKKLGFEPNSIVDLSKHLARHYGRVREELRSNYDEIVRISSKEYVDRMIEGLGHWIDAGNAGYLAWGILHFRKKA